MRHFPPANRITDNSSKANEDSGYTPSPSFSLTICDPRLNLTYALNKSYNRVIDMNADGMTSINMALKYRKFLGGDEVYDYDLSMSSIPAQSLVCDTGSNDTYYYGPCAISLFI